MFANTLTLTIDAVARTLTRNNQDNFGSVYQFEDATEFIEMKIRHDVDNQLGFKHKRHNVTVTRRVFATPVSAEKYWSTTVTLRNRDGSSPQDLLKTWQGVNTLLLTIDDGLVAGEN